MTTFIFVRHATNDWVKKGKLPGWTEGIHLNDEGRKQAAAAAGRLKPVKLDGLFASHLERAQETAGYIADGRKLAVQVRENLADLKTGEWTGKSVKQASKHKLWAAIQTRPAHTRMPGGESFSEMQGRLVAELDDIARRHPRGTVAVVSHADAIKAIVAHYLRLDLDHFQRIVISPASLTVVQVDGGMARLLRLNDTGPLEPFAAPHRPSKRARKQRGAARKR
ncbi:MAG: histidine phosphatase family protein [Chloroflexi bacterium]|nr:histidine phosphatase family protein [Chloroflexota bacterium]